MTLEALDNDRRKECEASSKCKQVWLNMVELGMYIYIYIYTCLVFFVYTCSDPCSAYMCLKRISTGAAAVDAAWQIWQIWARKPVVFAGMGHTCYYIISHPSIQ